MLTRDISLEDAILDLLDNCVDGILRSKIKQRGAKPYKGYKAEIEFNKHTFMIRDNCGGIPWNLHDYAFRMGPASGRPTVTPGTVGIYGIGLKRAIFKMGRDCLISTQNGEHRYEVEIKPEWIDDDETENAWKIPVKPAKRSMKEDGTTIVIGDLYPGIAVRFNEDIKSFQSELYRMVATHYAYIIDKGFEVVINGDSVQPRPTRLIFSSDKKTPNVQPFVFKTKTEDGVEVFLTVGFTRPIPSQDEINSEQVEKRYSTHDAGWTILCNDRAVLYCDRTELTGWGEAGVPRYHTQFIAISGVVEFRGDASKLPTTTTKRGIDASSQLYLQVKNKMREGMQIFTNYTNKWKGQADEAKKHILRGKPLSIEEIKEETEKLTFTTTKQTALPGKQYKPLLPLPKKLESQQRRISFTKNIDDIKNVSDYLFQDETVDPSVVGEKCFDLILNEARK